MKEWLKRVFSRDYLFKDIHPATLGLFRVVVGVTLLIQFNKEWFETYMVTVMPQAKFFLTYNFFHWVHVMPEENMRILFSVLKVASILVIIGFAYRPAMITLFLGWTYLFLLCNGHYNNHYYLISLITFLMVLAPADKWFSVRQIIALIGHLIAMIGHQGDWKFRFLKEWFQKEYKRMNKMPRWHLLIIQLQIWIVYFYGGLAKLNKDWLNGYPLKVWLPGKDVPLIKEWLYTESAALFFSWTGTLFDLAVGFMLFHKKLRWVALPAILLFHFSNHFLWTIGVFPWFMLVTTFIFFHDLIEKLFTLIWEGLCDIIKPQKKKGKKRNKTKAKVSTPSNQWWKGTAIQKASLAFFAIYMTWQLLFPFRQFLYPGETGWHGMGNDFAWRMMLIDRVYATKVIVKVPGEGTLGAIELGKYMTARQIKAMGHWPGHYIRFAHFLRDEMKENGLQKEPEIYAHVFRQYNGRPFQLFLDSTVNLVPLQVSATRIPEVLIPFEDVDYKPVGEFDYLTDEERDKFGY